MSDSGPDKIGQTCVLQYSDSLGHPEMVFLPGSRTHTPVARVVPRSPEGAIMMISDLGLGKETFEYMYFGSNATKRMRTQSST